MARVQRITIPPSGSVPVGDESGPGEAPDRDDMTMEELAQEKLGDLALLAGPEFQDWEWHIWRIRTKAEIATDPASGMRELMEKRIGPIDVFELQQQLGGGTFELWGFFNNGDGAGKRLRKKPMLTFAGPRKRFDVPASGTSAPAPASGTDPALVALLTRMDQRLSALELKPAEKPAAPASLKDMVDALVGLDSLRQRGAPAAPINPEKEIVTTMLGLVEKGIEIGREREPVAGEANPGTDWGKIFETAIPIVDRFLSRVPVRRPPPPSAPRPIAAEPVPPSSAAVVEPEKEASAVSYRWATAIESLANAIAEGDDPRDFTVTLERILNTQELGLLRGSTIEMVIANLDPAMGTYPILRTDGARSFIEAVLAELRNPSPDGSDGEQ